MDTTTDQPQSTPRGDRWGGPQPGRGPGAYADVNGLRLYDEDHGTGRPLVLPHGGLGAIELFGANLPTIAAGRRLIALDLQGHGGTTDIDRPLDGASWRTTWPRSSATSASRAPT